MHSGKYYCFLMLVKIAIALSTYIAAQCVPVWPLWVTSSQRGLYYMYYIREV
jgi:hypothetical protein